MTTQKKERIRSKVEESLSALEEEITALQEQCRPISPECALGDLARFELMHDQVVLEKRLDEALKRRARLKNTLLDIDKEHYGSCADCGDVIAYERLLLLPEARYCIHCAKAKD